MGRSLSKHHFLYCILTRIVSVFVGIGRYSDHDILFSFREPTRTKTKTWSEGPPKSGGDAAGQEMWAVDAAKSKVSWRWKGGVGNWHFIIRPFSSICNLQATSKLVYFPQVRVRFSLLVYGERGFLYVNSHYKFLDSFGLYIQRLLPLLLSMCELPLVLCTVA